MIGMAFCGGAYILTFYPSWQVPLGYAFLALIVGVIIVDRKECIFVWKRDFAFLLLLCFTGRRNGICPFEVAGYC